ncbi:MAG: hypothetical protein KDN22_28990 [Verrucomicrobiae bacterium]|nr:hypothetical protein [Verrucomicrobiae bacterium]
MYPVFQFSAFLAAFNVGFSGGTILVLAVSLAAGYATGLCIWREDRKRYSDAAQVNAGLKAQIEEARSDQFQN